MAMSDVAEAATLNYWLNNIVGISPVSVYVALFTTDPADDASGTEVSGVGYARIIRTAGFTVTSPGGTATNIAVITFPQAGAGGWGTVTHVAIFDALAAGTLLFHGALAASRIVLEDDVFQIAAGDLDLTQS